MSISAIVMHLKISLSNILNTLTWCYMYHFTLDEILHIWLSAPFMKDFFNFVYIKWLQRKRVLQKWRLTLKIWIFKILKRHFVICLFRVPRVSHILNITPSHDSPYPIKNYRCCTGGPLLIMGDNYPCMLTICCA